MINLTNVKKFVATLTKEQQNTTIIKHNDETFSWLELIDELESRSFLAPVLAKKFLEYMKN